MQKKTNIVGNSTACQLVKGFSRIINSLNSFEEKGLLKNSPGFWCHYAFVQNAIFGGGFSLDEIYI